MQFYSLLVAAFCSLVFLMAVFIPMEKVFPANKQQPIFRRQWILDLCFFLGQFIIWNGLLLWLLSFASDWVTEKIPSTFTIAVQSQPWWLQAFEVVFLSDFLIYWGHRIQHKYQFLWRFHKVHHSSEHLDWLAAHREHPLDSVYTVGIINLPAILMGFPLETIAGLIAFRGIWAIYIHSNVRLNLGPLKAIIGSPDLHHWHHDKNRFAGNYANISPIMDIIFGTYSCPNEEPKEFGIEEETPKTYVGQLIEPMIPKKK